MGHKLNLSTNLLIHVKISISLFRRNWKNVEKDKSIWLFRRMWRMQRNTWKHRPWSWNSLLTGTRQGTSLVELPLLTRWWWWWCLSWTRWWLLVWLPLAETDRWWWNRLSSRSQRNVYDQNVCDHFILTSTGCQEVWRVKEMFAPRRWLLQRNSQHFPGKIMMILFLTLQMQCWCSWWWLMILTRHIYTYLKTLNYVISKYYDRGPLVQW